MCSFYYGNHLATYEVKVLVAQSSPTLWDPMDCSPFRLLCLWDSPGKNTGVGSHSLLQEISPTQRSNPGLPHVRQILYHLSHQGSCNIYVYQIILYALNLQSYMSIIPQ